MATVAPTGVGIGPRASVAPAVLGRLTPVLVEASNRPGDGTVRRRVQDGQGRRVVDAIVVCVVEMDGMAMGFARAPGTPIGDGRDAARAPFGTAGRWLVRGTVRRPGGTPVDFVFAVAIPSREAGGSARGPTLRRSGGAKVRTRPEPPRAGCNGHRAFEAAPHDPAVEETEGRKPVAAEGHARRVSRPGVPGGSPLGRQQDDEAPR